MPNGYDSHSSAFARPGRAPLTEAAATKRSDGASSQDRSGANRYDTSTPEKRRTALAAARRSGNPADEARVRKQINQEANSTIDALMLGLGSPTATARRDNRVTRRGGYRSTLIAVDEATEYEARSDLPPWLKDRDVEEAKGGGLPPWLKDKAKDGKGSGGDSDEDSNLPPWLRDRKKSGKKTAESAALPPRRFRDTVDSMDEAALNAKRRNALPASDFAGPDRTYPIDTPARARAALARAKANASPAEQRRIYAAVKRKYPDMQVDSKPGS